MNNTIAILTAAALLGGCASASQFTATSAARCLLAGHQPGSPTYDACVRVTSQTLATNQNQRVAAGVVLGLAAGAVAAAVTAPRNYNVNVYPTPQTYHVNVYRY